MSRTMSAADAELKETSERTAIFTECGHFGARRFELKIFGQEYVYNLSSDHVKMVAGKETVDGTCPSCFIEQIKQAAIRCCVCGEVILPGEHVALYHKDSGAIKEELATFVEDHGVGCLRANCCPSLGFFSGTWTTNGFKSAYPDSPAIK